MKLSIICPCYNEERTCKRVVEDLLKLTIDKEIIVVDDGSTDKSNEILKTIKGITLITKSNGGKGSAMKEGLKFATGDVCVPFDLDGEYDVNDLPLCMDEINRGALVVYGSRRLCKTNKQYSSLSYFIGGTGLTIITNVLFLSSITDEPCCFKMARKEIYDRFPIIDNDFAFEPTLTGNILKNGIRIHEVPCHYYPREIKAGKKIKWQDGFKAVWALLKCRFTK